jgi:HMG (high mobility group) box
VRLRLSAHLQIHCLLSSLLIADRILHGGEIEWTKEKQEKLLHDHWNQDRTKKRRHRKSHGKIDFSTLSKVISTRWKELPEDRKDYFREVAARDWERFQRELAEYKHGASIDAAAAGGGASSASANAFASYSFSTVIG